MFNAATEVERENHLNTEKLDDDTVICKSGCTAVINSAAGGAGPLSVEGNMFSLFDWSTQKQHVFWSIGIGPGGNISPSGPYSGGASLEISPITGPTTIGTVSGLGGSLNLFVAAGAGYAGSAVASYNDGNPAMLAVSGGVAVGYGATASALSTYTFYDGSSAYWSGP